MTPWDLRALGDSKEGLRGVLIAQMPIPRAFDANILDFLIFQLAAPVKNEIWSQLLQEEK